MRKSVLFALCGACVLLSGCGKKDEDAGRLLADADLDTVNEVKNFSAFEETELATEPPETEPQTVATEPPETEAAETEPPETEPAEEPYSKDYDFSDTTILSAMFAADGGLGNVPYTSEVTENADGRTQTITAKDGNMVLTLIADRYSGTSSQTAKLSLTGDEKEKASDILLAFDNGITEENVEKFLQGGYSENAALLGLKDASVESSGGALVITLTKNENAEGEVPYWQEISLPVSTLIGTDKMDTKLQDGADLFGSVLNGITMGSVTLSSSEASILTVTSDESGNITGQYVRYEAGYTGSDGATYTVSTARDENGVPTMTLETHRADCTEDSTVMQFAGHIYQSLYTGNFDVSASLPYTTDHCTVEKTTDGFKMVFSGT